jgi:cytoskeletal protein CcmA (bactofilin family)
MLRFGRNQNEETSQTKANTEDYSSRSYSSYQPDETNTRPGIESAPVPKALTDSETIAREIKDGTLNGFVCSGALVTGEATFKAMLRIDGRFSGKITSDNGTLMVGAGGRVDANIDVAVAMVQGVVNGDIIASKRVELGRAAQLTGNIQTPALVIESGAMFEGISRMVQQQADARKRAEVERKDNVVDTSKVEPVEVDRSKYSKVEPVEVDRSKYKD